MSTATTQTSSPFGFKSVSHFFSTAFSDLKKATSFAEAKILPGVQTGLKEAETVTAALVPFVPQASTALLIERKLTNDARLTVDNVNKAAIDERFYFEKQLPGFMERADRILQNVEVATADLHPLLQETTARTHDLEAIEKNAGDLLLSGHRLLVDVDATARDPHIASSLANLDASTAQLTVAAKSGAATAVHVEHMAADGEAEVHSLTHPRPLISIANWTMKIAGWVWDRFKP